MKLLGERKKIIDEIIETMTRENTDALEKVRKVKKLTARDVQ